MAVSLRVLCLHGKGSSSSIFKSKLEPLIQHVGSGAHWDFLQAPYIFSKESETAQWRILPEGVRSFEASHYMGSNESIELVESHIAKKSIDLLIGHSQGSMLAAVILARKLSLASETTAGKSLAAILSSPAWPLPYHHLMTELQPSPANETVRCVFTVGSQDKINPPAHTRELCQHFQRALGERCVLLEHDGGHSLPTDPASLALYDQHLFNALST